MKAKTPALILVGIQNDFFPGGLMPLEGMAAAAAKAAELLAVFRGRDWPRFHVQQVSIRNGATHFLAGTAGVELHDLVCPGEIEPVIVKHVANCFRDSTLHDDLWEANVGELVICGATSNLCVDATVRHAADFGYDCTVIHDACAAHALAFGSRTVVASDVHAASMATLAGYARVTSLEAWKSALAPEALAA